MLVKCVICKVYVEENEKIKHNKTKEHKDNKKALMKEWIKLKNEIRSKTTEIGYIKN